MINYIASFCEEFQYPTEAKQILLSTYKALTLSTAASEIFLMNVGLYNQDKLNDYCVVLSSLNEVAELCNVHRYTIHLLFFICLSEHTRELYEKNKFSYEVFYDSMSDLKWKLFECHQMNDVWGNSVALWDSRFFNLSLFALGRLQFEIKKYTGTYTKSQNFINPNDMVVNIHIPSCGQLLPEDCFASYRKAAAFFKEYFTHRPTVFVCHSWLLFPPHREFLPKDSNIIKFMNNFDIISTSIDEAGSDLWRIFNKDHWKQPSDLPTSTSLQRAYANWLTQGNPVGIGYGVFFFDGECIL